MPPKREITNEDRAKVMEVALTWLGTPYLLGGRDRQGIGCSNFVSNVYREALGIRLIPWTDWMYLNLKIIPQDQLEIGDIIFFCKDPRPYGRLVTHVGLYLAEGQIIHASYPPRKVAIQSIDEVGLDVIDTREDHYITRWIAEMTGRPILTTSGE